MNEPHFEWMRRVVSGRNHAPLVCRWRRRRWQTWERRWWWSPAPATARRFPTATSRPRTPRDARSSRARTTPRSPPRTGPPHTQAPGATGSAWWARTQWWPRGSCELPRCGPRCKSWPPPRARTWGKYQHAWPPRPDVRPPWWPRTPRTPGWMCWSARPPPSAGGWFAASRSRTTLLRSHRLKMRMLARLGRPGKLIFPHRRDLWCRCCCSWGRSVTTCLASEFGCLSSCSLDSGPCEKPYPCRVPLIINDKQDDVQSLNWKCRVILSRCQRMIKYGFLMLIRRL